MLTKLLNYFLNNSSYFVFLKKFLINLNIKRFYIYYFGDIYILFGILFLFYTSKLNMYTHLGSFPELLKKHKDLVVRTPKTFRPTKDLPSTCFIEQTPHT